MYLGRIEVGTEVFDVPGDLDVTADARLDPPEMVALQTALADGRAQRLNRIQTTHTGGTTNAVTAGEHASYLQDLDVEPLEADAPPNAGPKSLLDGVATGMLARQEEAEARR